MNDNRVIPTRVNGSAPADVLGYTPQRGAFGRMPVISPLAPDGKIYAARLIDAAAAYTNLETSVLRRSRVQRAAEARQAIMYVAREDACWTFADCGAVVGRDHTTAHHAHRVIGQRLSADVEVRDLVASLRVVQPILAVEQRRQAIADLARSVVRLSAATRAACDHMEKAARETLRMLEGYE